MSSPETNVVGKLLQEKPTAARSTASIPCSLRFGGRTRRLGTTRTVGRAVLENLLTASFKKSLRRQCKAPGSAGRKTYASIRDVPDPWI